MPEELKYNYKLVDYIEDFFKLVRFVFTFVLIFYCGYLFEKYYKTNSSFSQIIKTEYNTIKGTK